MLEIFFNQDKIEAGCDEAGRGCLAGPVFAAAVILPPNFSCPELNDSKKLTEKKRDDLRLIIEEKALSFSVGEVNNVEIDQMNILRASFLAMHRAIEKLTIEPQFLIIDGNRFVPYHNIPYKCIVKGDGKYQSIAAASILAKTYRDSYMKQLDKEYPQYDWANNKGYPTERHRFAIKKYGITSYHRKSFALFDRQLSLDL